MTAEGRVEIDFIRPSRDGGRDAFGNLVDVLPDFLAGLLDGLLLRPPGAALLELAEPGLDERLGLGVAPGARARSWPATDPAHAVSSVERSVQEGERCTLATRARSL